MHFYYMSIISLAAVVIFYFIALWIVRGFWSVSRKDLFANTVALTIAAVVLVAPWAEELWIAYNFGQLCKKDAGIFINKTVEVEGFYDGSGRTITRIVGMPLYQFVESKDGRGYRRVEKATAEEKAQAIAWFNTKYPGKVLAKGSNNWIMHPVSPQVQVNVEIDTDFAWRVTKLDKPTARYHYKWGSMDEPMSHKVDKIERVVMDSKTGELLARETKYRRQAYWFYVGLDRPVILCPAPGQHPLSKHGSVFNLALKPTQTK